MASESDGVHGRFDGDWDLAIGAGALLSARAPNFSVRTSAHYFSVAGLFVGYGDPVMGAGDRHEVSVGVDVRPVFLPRIALDLRSGATWSDLILDSASLAMGGYWTAPPDAEFGSVRGFETSLGCGFPLLLHAAGPWLELRGRLHFPDPNEQALASLQLLFTWHTLWVSPLATNAP